MGASVRESRDSDEKLLFGVGVEDVRGAEEGEKELLGEEKETAEKAVEGALGRVGSA
jgi:hypothetical protein